MQTYYDGYKFSSEADDSVYNPTLSIYFLDAFYETCKYPQPTKRDAGKDAAKRLYQHGEMLPLCDFVKNRYFRVFHNRDYRQANELAVKTAFLTLLYNDILFIMDSEKETGRRYADLTMIIRPYMRRFKISDILIEFKFIQLKDAGVNGEAAKKLAPQALKNNPVMRSAMKDACA